MKQNITLFLCLICISFYSQIDYLKNYIPYDTSSYSTHPIIKIKTWIHIVQKSKIDPKNLTSDSISYLSKQYQWINQMYAKLKPPTLPNQNGETPYIQNARVKFVIDTISYHIDENAWDRLKSISEKNKAKWLEILKIDAETNTILIKGIRDRYKPILDSVIICETEFNNTILNVIKAERDGRNTRLHINEKLSFSEDSIGYISYYKEINKNCHKDNWSKITNENKEYLHVFYTGSSKDAPAFGCGPSPYFLNISRVINNGDYASAQLIAHELGHCLGLRHTDNPQFKDLPKTDQFGWIKCNNSTASNNIMGYNTCRNYLSPLQVAYIHYRYSNNENLFGCIKQNYNPNQPIYIRKNTKWGKSVILEKDIIVKKNKTLTISNNLIMADNSSIYLEKKAKLILDSGKIFNPNNKWNGIIKCRSEFKKNKKPIFKRNIPLIDVVNNGKITY